MQLGNFKWESTVFNSRLQPTQIALGTTQAAYDVLKLNYDYGSTQNNGNIQSQTITVPTVGSNTGFTATQTYTYDSLNRLKDAKELIGSTETWKQTFTFDRYGNRNFDEANTTTLPKNCGTSPNFTVCAADRKVLNPSVNTSNNRLSTSDDYTFDSSGNTTKDAQNRKFTYDGENKQTKVETVNSGGTVTGTLGEYFYDGDGKRVKKVSATETTIFVYDASGKMVAEYSTQPAATQQVSYLTTDHLGSPRINTNENGTVTARHDYQPFGEEIATSQRIAGLGYNSDEIRKKFTSYERDSETELNFAQARYQNAAYGRFNSPDPYNIILEVKAEKDEKKASAKLKSYLSIPQQWNRFIYVLNNPLKFIDPTGEIFELIGTEAERNRAFEWLRKALGDEAGKKLHVEHDGGHFYVTFSGTDEDGNGLGEVLNSLIDSNSATQFTVTVNDNYKLLNGETIDLNSLGGATTSMIDKNTNQIVINSSAVFTANNFAKERGEKDSTGNIITHTIETLVAHELGHAWGAVRDNTFERMQNANFMTKGEIKQQNKDRSLIAENKTRQRLGLGLRVSHY